VCCVDREAVETDFIGVGGSCHDNCFKDKCTLEMCGNILEEICNLRGVLKCKSAVF